MAQVDTNREVVVFGGSGFLGRYVVRALAKRGHRVRIACRRPDLAYHLLPNGKIGQILPIQANLRYRWSIDRAVGEADHVINLVGLLAESGKQTFDALQNEGAKAIAEASRAVGAPLTQISAIGADRESPSRYAQSKAAGEAAVREARPDAVIMRPSIIFGPEDDFFNRFAAMARMAPALPLIGGGHTRFQPIFVADVAEAIADTVDGKVAGGQTFELGGPEVLTFRQMMETMLGVIKRKRPLVSIPFGVAGSMARAMRFVPNAPLTEDQVRQLQIDNVVSEAAERDGRTIKAFTETPRSVDAILPTYLVRFRPNGQFMAPHVRGGAPAATDDTGV